MSRRAAFAIVLVVWAVFWMCGWITAFGTGTVGKTVSIGWLLMFGYLVVETRAARVPRSVHLIGWMTALLLVTMVKAWRFDPTAEPALFQTWFQQQPQLFANDSMTAHDRAAMDAILGSVLAGIGLGLGGALEMLVIAIATWIGGLLRPDREPARVDWVPRLVVIVLQLPLLLALAAAGFGLVGGGTTYLVHDVPLSPALRGEDAPAIWALGAGLWALAVFQLDRWFALARGAWWTRGALALLAVAATAGVLASGAGIAADVATLVWCALQLLALRWARPARP
jgi:hypothetical protein